MTALDLVVRHGIDPLFLLAALWLFATFTSLVLPRGRS